jgi:hypothetical protein
METICSSEMLVDFHRTIRHIPADRTLHVIMYLFDITVLKISARVRLRHPKEH